MKKSFSLYQSLITTGSSTAYGFPDQGIGIFVTEEPMKEKNIRSKIVIMSVGIQGPKWYKVNLLPNQTRKRKNWEHPTKHLTILEPQISSIDFFRDFKIYKGRSGKNNVIRL